MDISMSANELMTEAYEAFLEYVQECFKNPHATDTDRMLIQHRLASAAGLTPQQKSWLDAWVFEDNRAVKDPRNAQGVVELDLDDEGTPCHPYRVDI